MRRGGWLKGKMSSTLIELCDFALIRHHPQESQQLFFLFLFFGRSLRGSSTYLSYSSLQGPSRPSSADRRRDVERVDLGCGPFLSSAAGQIFRAHGHQYNICLAHGHHSTLCLQSTVTTQLSALQEGGGEATSSERRFNLLLLLLLPLLKS